MNAKLPQNIQTLVGDIGEQQVLLRLGILAHQRPGWQVFRNIGEAGFDILLVNQKRKKRVAIEVKTRQKLYTTGKNRNSIAFQLTAGEYQSCDFLIAHLLERGLFLIVRKAELKRISGGRLWRFVLTLNNQGVPHPRFQKSVDAWHLLSNDFKDFFPKYSNTPQSTPIN